MSAQRSIPWIMRSYYSACIYPLVSLVTLLSWLTSFLSERSMCVVHGLSISSWVPAPYGLPQGSVLGPLLYIIYTSDIASILASQAMHGQLYADDVQAYKHCPASDALVTVSAMSRTMEALGSWMSSNRLRLNPHTRLNLFGSGPASSLLN